MKCSVCQSEIKEKYCPRCGQTFTNSKFKWSTLFRDLSDGLFSLERSFYSNLKLALLYPGKLVKNYWKGYRGYYYSPARFLAIAALLISINFLLGFKFIYITVLESGLAPQFVLLLVLILLFSISSKFAYFKQAPNFLDHLVMNIYILSTWTILFFPISLLINYFDLTILGEIAQYAYICLISIWCSLCFDLNWFKRALYSVLQLALFLALFYLL